MHFHRSYDNGLQVVTAPVQGTDSVTALILVRAGSRYETKAINGISHYLEHMFFKGAQRYPTSRAVSAAIDGVGGEFNAFTGKEYAGYYIKIASAHLERALDVLSDMLLASRFDPAEIDKERGVIMGEYNMYQDTPMYQVQWDFERLAFGDQPLGWDEVGTKELIMGVTREDFLAYRNALYTSDNTIINIAGNCDPDRVAQLVKQYFPFGEGKRTLHFEPYQPKPTPKRISLVTKKTEQAHLCLGFEAFTYHDPRRFAVDVLSTILGGNMSSRMFQSIREERGLAYYVQTTGSEYHDTGVFYTRSGVSLDKIDEAISVIRDEYRKIATERPTPAELRNAKEYLKGKLALQMEDSEAVAHYYGKQQLLTGNIEDLKQRMELIDSVDEEQVRSTAEALLANPLLLSVIGPYEDRDHFEALLRN